MKSILALLLCVITLSAGVFSQPIKAQASYAVPAGYGADFVRALYSLFETVLIVTGIAQGVDNYSECDSLWEAFNEFVNDIVPGNPIPVESNVNGELIKTDCYLEGTIKFEECQVQIYQGKWYVYGYEGVEHNGLVMPDCYAVFDNMNDFLVYMGCPVELPETTWRQFTVLEGGKSDTPEPSPDPELDMKTQIAFTGGTVGVMVEYIKKVVNGEIEGINPDDYITPDYGKKEDILIDEDAVIEIIENQNGYDKTLHERWGVEMPDYSFTGFQEYGEAGNTIVNGVCYVEWGYNNEDATNVLRRYFIETYQPDNVCLQLKWCEKRNVFGYNVSDPHYELKMFRTVGDNSIVITDLMYQEYDPATGTWGEAKKHNSTKDPTYILSIGGAETLGDPCFEIAFDCPIFKYGEAGASATAYFNDKTVNEDDLLNGELYNPLNFVNSSLNIISPLEDRLIDVDDLKDINEVAYQAFTETVPDSTNKQTNTENLSDAISDAVSDAIEDKGEVILPAPEFYPETEPNPEIVNPETQPDAEPTAEPTAEPDTEPTSSPATDVGGDTGNDSQIETETTPQPTSPPQDLTEDMQKYKVDLTKIFPFCIPFDLVALLETLDAEPVTPYFEFPFVVQSLDIDMVVPIDLSWMEEIMVVFRQCMKVSFILCLIMVTGKVIKW